MDNKKTPVVYLVDSENVNDAWIQLVTCMEEQDEILVFYTEKSPHMSYEKVIELTQLSNRPIQWVKCVEGCNALDFQLVTELGARVATQSGYEFVVVSNDVGFDAAVKYWTNRDKNVRRMKSTECRKLTKNSICNTKNESGGQETDTSVITDAESAQNYQSDIEQLSQSIPLDKLTLYHDAFVCMLDQGTGDELYYYMKERLTELAYLEKNYLQKRKARLKNYYGMALTHAGIDTRDLDQIMDIYHDIDEPKKNLQKLNVELVKLYGQEQGTAYYKVMKKHVKIMSKL